MEESLYEIHYFAEHFVKTAGQKIKQAMAKELDIHTKSNANDLVTNADVLVEKYLVGAVKTRFPHHNVVSEEGFGDQQIDWSGFVWGIDPIDGTFNFVHQRKNFAISVGIYRDGVGELGYIYDVMADRLYTVKRGDGIYQNGVLVPKREDRNLCDSSFYCRFGYLYENRYHLMEIVHAARDFGAMTCASLGFVELALGNVDGMIGKGNMKFWDIAAGKIFAEEGGVLFRGVDGSPYQLCEEKDIIAAGPHLLLEVSTRFLGAAPFG